MHTDAWDTTGLILVLLTIAKFKETSKPIGGGFHLQQLPAKGISIP